MKKTVTIILFIFFSLCLAHSASAEDELYTPQEIREMLGMGGDEYIASGGDIFSAVVKIIKKSNISPLSSVFSVLATLALGAVLQAVGSLFEQASPVYSLACRTCCALMLFGTIKNACLATKNAIDMMVAVTSSLLTVMCVSGVGTASLASAASHATTVLILLDFLSSVASRAVMPVTYCSLGLTLASSLSPLPSLTGMINGAKKLAVTLLSAACGIFSFCLTLQSVSLGGIERAIGRGVRFAASSFVPIIGSSLSESTAAVIASMKTLRRLSCTSCLFVILLIGAVPFVMLLCNKLVLHIASLGADMLSLEGEKKLIDGINELLSIMLAALLSCFTVMVVCCATFMSYSYA